MEQILPHSLQRRPTLQHLHLALPAPELLENEFLLVSHSVVVFCFGALASYHRELGVGGGAWR
jgi:hypothetical protein